MALTRQQYTQVRTLLRTFCVDVRAEVLAAIRNSYALSINMRWRHIHINSLSLHKVAHLIESGRILTLFEVNPNNLPRNLRVASDEAQYLEECDVLLMGFRQVNTDYLRSAVLHELVHARADVKARPMHDLTNEMAAYIYQFMYLQKVQFSAPQSRYTSLVTSSSNIAAALLAGRKPSPGDENSLQNAILAMPLYARQTHGGSRQRMFDGIR